jgi:putative addiction module component (TIGR02574 family)
MNNVTAIPIESFTVAEKLLLMERLWEDLSKQPSNVEPPEWHGDVLAARLAAVKEGRTEFVDWDAAKERLRNRLKWKFGSCPGLKEILRFALIFMSHNSQVLALISMTALSRTSNLCGFILASIKSFEASIARFPSDAPKPPNGRFDDGAINPATSSPLATG